MEIENKVRLLILKFYSYKKYHFYNAIYTKRTVINSFRFYHVDKDWTAPGWTDKGSWWVSDEYDDGWGYIARNWFWESTPDDPLNGEYSYVPSNSNDNSVFDNQSKLINSIDYYHEYNTNDIKKDDLIMEFKDNDILIDSSGNSHTHICESNGEHNHDTTNWDDETAPPSISMVPFIKY